MADEIISLGVAEDDCIAFDEDILKILNESWDPYFDEDCVAYDPEIYALLHENLEGLDDPRLFDICEDVNEEWLDDDDEWMLQAEPQHGGNPLFSIRRERFGEPRNWQDGTIVQDQMRFRLIQNRAPQGEHLAEAIAEAFYTSIRQYLREQQINPRQYYLQMKLHLNGDKTAWHSSPLLPADDWINNLERTRQWLEHFTKMLNSSRSIDPTKDDISVEFLLVKLPGTGGRRKKYNIQRMSFADMLKKKRCLIAINNKDNLCAARAIVTVKALVNGDTQFNNLKKGLPIQERLARLLHREANVAEKPCGRKELKQFQEFLGHQYQLIVVEGMKGQMFFKNKQYDDAPNIIALVKMNTHYHAVTSLPAFLNRSYFCQYCGRGYNDENAEHHNCKGQNCLACRRGKQRCKNFASWETPSYYCQDCQRRFYGPDCFQNHLQGTEKRKSVCKRFKKCLTCCKTFKRTKQHLCFNARCGNCGRIQAVSHQCFIQPYKPKKRSEQEEEDETEKYIGQSEEEDEDVRTFSEDEKPPPVIVAFDIECAATPIEGTDDKLFEPVLIGWSTLREPEDYHEVTTIKAFLEAMNAKTNYEGKERDVYCFAHNLRAFDGMFIQAELYDQGVTIHSILNQGAKYLSFQCGNLIFRDSMNFFSMPLEKLSATFNLKELHKGFFPYGMISARSAGFRGPFPPPSAYNPDRMSDKRRKSFYTWYAEQQGKMFDYDKELSLYLKSDVLVLKEALTAFNSEMWSLTGVEPLIECVTIACTAFRVWQQNFLTKNLIALEPMEGWRMNQVNQSDVALEWLAYEQTKVEGLIQVSLLFKFRETAIVFSEKSLIRVLLFFFFVACTKCHGG